MAVSLVPSVLRTKSNIAAGQTDSALVTAVTGKKVRVLGVALANGSAGATTITFNTKPGGAGTAVSAAFSLGASGTLVLPVHDYGWFESSSGEGLTATTSSGATVAVQVVYTLLPG